MPQRKQIQPDGSQKKNAASMLVMLVLEKPPLFNVENNILSCKSSHTLQSNSILPHRPDVSSLVFRVVRHCFGFLVFDIGKAGE